MEKRWMLRRTGVDVKKTAKEAGVYGITAKVLINRGIDTPEKIKGFFDVSLNGLNNPYLMKDMDKGIKIIKESIDDGKKIVIYGDYDADGVTSTAILYKTLKHCGADVVYHIPHREHEGYGMNKDRIRKLKEQGREVIITCDNGISALGEIELAKELGFTVVVTDHHELPFEEGDEGRNYIMPVADAVINPKRMDCEYPFKSLCGAGIAFKFSLALMEKMNIDKSIIPLLIQYASIGTICDVVDLVGENRIIAINGLNEMGKTECLGLRALIEILGVEKGAVKAYNIGFQIGPCINATGRLEIADISLELLITEEEGNAKELAKRLFDLNKKRQDMTNENVEGIIESLRGNIKDKVIVVYKKDIHESIAGIVAGRVKETFNLPTFILTQGKEMPKGSGRSIEEYNMFEEMIKCKDVLYKFGGHPMAAGLSIEEDKIDAFREKINGICMLTDEDVIPKLRIDNRLPLEHVTFNLVEELSCLEPFGKGNSKPLFAEKNIDLVSAMFLGKDRNTLKLVLKSQNGVTIEGIGFNKVREFKEMMEKKFGTPYEEALIRLNRVKLDMVFYPSINTFRGKRSLVLKIEEIRISDI